MRFLILLIAIFLCSTAFVMEPNLASTKFSVTDKKSVTDTIVAYRQSVHEFLNTEQALQTKVLKGSQQFSVTVRRSTNNTYQGFIHCELFANDVKLGYIVFEPQETSVYVALRENLRQDEGYSHVGTALDEYVFKASVVLGRLGHLNNFAIKGSCGFHWKCGFRPAPSHEIACIDAYYRKKYSNIVNQIEAIENGRASASKTITADRLYLELVAEFESSKAPNSDTHFTYSDVVEHLFARKSRKIVEIISSDTRDGLKLLDGPMVLSEEARRSKFAKFNLCEAQALQAACGYNFAAKIDQLCESILHTNGLDSRQMKTAYRVLTNEKDPHRFKERIALIYANMCTTMISLSIQSDNVFEQIAQDEAVTMVQDFEFVIHKLIRLAGKHMNSCLDIYIYWFGLENLDEFADKAIETEIDRSLRLLGLQRGCTREQIRAAFKERNMRGHADKGNIMSDYDANELVKAKNLLIEIAENWSTVKDTPAEVATPAKVLYIFAS